MNLPSELRFAARSLARSPVFSSVAMLSLALGIGANMAVFTLLDQVLLRPLPVQDPQHLVQLKEVGDFYGSKPFRTKRREWFLASQTFVTIHICFDR
jgi:hypothetical protein